MSEVPRSPGFSPQPRPRCPGPERQRPRPVTRLLSGPLGGGKGGRLLKNLCPPLPTPARQLRPVDPAQVHGLQGLPLSPQISWAATTAHGTPWELQTPDAQGACRDFWAQTRVILGRSAGPSVWLAQCPWGGAQAPRILMLQVIPTCS